MLGHHRRSYASMSIAKVGRGAIGLTKKCGMVLVRLFQSK
jgi:hypothetical protein